MLSIRVITEITRAKRCERDNSQTDRANELALPCMSQAQPEPNTLSGFKLPFDAFDEPRIRCELPPIRGRRRRPWSQVFVVPQGVRVQLICVFCPWQTENQAFRSKRGGCSRLHASSILEGSRVGNEFRMARATWVWSQ